MTERPADDGADQPVDEQADNARADDQAHNREETDEEPNV